MFTGAGGLRWVVSDEDFVVARQKTQSLRSLNGGMPRENLSPQRAQRGTGVAWIVVACSL